ncbi:MAG: SAM-dependent methyltransferase, partial [Bacteroidales bacterium]
IQEVKKFSKKEIQSIAATYPYADLSARNFPLDTNGLKKLSGIKDGGNCHIFAVTVTDGSRKIIVAK